MIRIMLNGEPRELQGPVSAAALIASLGFEAKKVALERNREIVPKSTFAEVMILDGDELELVHFIGGG